MSDFQHPLHDAAMSAFAERAHHDRVTMAAFLGAGCRERAYLKVAEDVLACMELAGALTRDEHGWFKKAEGWMR